jgi:hypothetical protein
LWLGNEKQLRLGELELPLLKLSAFGLELVLGPVLRLDGMSVDAKVERKEKDNELYDGT